jgi:hypothetical protein
MLPYKKNYTLFQWLIATLIADSNSLEACETLWGEGRIVAL